MIIEKIILPRRQEHHGWPQQGWNGQERSYSCHQGRPGNRTSPNFDETQRPGKKGTSSKFTQMIHCFQDFAQRQHCDLCADPISVRTQFSLYNDERSKNQKMQIVQMWRLVRIVLNHRKVILSENHLFCCKDQAKPLRECGSHAGPDSDQKQLRGS